MTGGTVTDGTVVPLRRRRVIGLLAALALLVLLLLASIAVGSRDIPFAGVLDALLHDTGEGDAYVVWSLRVPRTAVLLATGIALGVAGMLIQALTRNPLADPGILGVNAGAALFVALGIAVFHLSSPGQYVWFSFAGALLATVVVYAVGSAGRGSIDPIQLTLAGVTLGSILFGVVSAMTLLDRHTFEQMRNWNAGSVASRGWDVLLPVLPFLVAGVIVAIAVAGPLNAIALGDDLATSLGVHIGRTQVIVVVAVTLLAGGATAIAGPIGFVGLMAPHVVRWIVGPDQRWILGGTLLLAPALLTAADVVGRTVMRPGELPVGIVMAFVGAPILVLLVRRRRVSAL